MKTYKIDISYEVLATMQIAGKTKEQAENKARKLLEQDGEQAIKDYEVNDRNIII